MNAFVGVTQLCLKPHFLCSHICHLCGSMCVFFSNLAANSGTWYHVVTATCFWHSRSHSVPHLPVHLSASYHCEVLHLSWVCFNAYVQTVDVCGSQISSENDISFYPFWVFFCLCPCPKPARLEISVWSNILTLSHTALPDAQRCQTNCAELTHVIRWVNPIKSAGSEENQVNSPFKSWLLLSDLVHSIPAKTRLSCLTQVRWWWCVCVYHCHRWHFIQRDHPQTYFHHEKLICAFMFVLVLLCIFQACWNRKYSTEYKYSGLLGN